MECWNIGIMGIWVLMKKLFSCRHHSIISVFHYSSGGEDEELCREIRRYFS